MTSTYVLAEAISVMGVTGAAFVSTNLDNLVVLSAYAAKPGYRPLPIKLSFVLVCLLVLVVSLALGRAAGALRRSDHSRRAANHPHPTLPPRGLKPPPPLASNHAGATENA